MDSDENTFMYILDMCQSLSDMYLKQIQACIDCIIENRKEESEENE